MREHGFTLIELLVSMAIFGILIAAVLNFQSSAMKTSGVMGNQATRLQTISDVTGYVGDRVKTARTVYAASTTVGGATCDITATPACLAIEVPVLGTVGDCAGLIVGWQKVAYRYVLWSSLAATERTPMAGISSVAYAMQEIRGAASGDYISVTTNCTIANQPAAPTVTTTSLLDDTLALTSGHAAFAYTATTKTVTIKVRSVSATGGTLRYSPTTGPYILTIFARNVL
ncbi:type II secretion system protein [Deinococcus deserti]|uniref:Putative prepilin-like protein n=1 Tax=Deinococcus deserti (strain DSM 17065 / CIP 109153 / LMG 22923 / VCD115) TaxID=546414 RepID=C1D0Y5_DEIDV|nr:type II secretion system protein [Deinococcus deserti]ACO45509.1 putative prepilin-like protein, precursor [Deinococcus deserti VCD115]